MRKIVIDSRVIKHLGRDLITSSEVAVIELVKNSIDAKARNINLRISSNGLPMEMTDIIRSAGISEEYLHQPVLCVEDDGIGMTDKVIDDGFLIVATDIKANEKGVLGQKGIGRLATQRLGSALLVETSSVSENHTSYIFIDWKAVISGRNDVRSFETAATSPHTRLWIFGINLDDYIDNAIEFQQLSLDGVDVTEPPVLVNRNLKSALNYLISPFENENNFPKVQLYFDNRLADTSFPKEMLKLAESVHSFRFDPDNNDILNYELAIQPWFIERTHRSSVKADAFSRLKKPHEYYADFLLKNASRIDNVLKASMSKDELIGFLSKRLNEFYATNDSPDKKAIFERFIHQKTNEIIDELTKIAPIKGSIYSFKQGKAIGENIIIDGAFKLGQTKKHYSKNELKHFLEDYNGVKLYRDTYRIGFLGDKESDWIKLQQFRTKGQQYFRFDLGNTVGFVALTDDSQEKIQEISSRLDISRNKTSDAFKMLINVVFNYLFYELNGKAYSIISILLAEEGLLGESLAKRVKKSDADLKQMIRRNARIQKALQEVSLHFDLAQKIEGTDQIAIPEKSYAFVTKALKAIDEDIRADSVVQEKTAVLLSEADAQLKAIQVESYNNFKLMANGLITETITHELHSLCKTGISSGTEEHFDILKEYFFSNGSVPIYNSHVDPIRNNYTNIVNKLDEVADLYSFLENTFIRKGSMDEFIYQNINSVVCSIRDNLKETIKKVNIPIICLTGDLTWFVPKGVLLHVFYNLINNSLYWIDVRKKNAHNDPHYIIQKNDEIMIEKYSENGIVVSDTGTGVSRNMEDILFEPLQSGKPNFEGRGMGLYIVRKLLNSFGGEIELLEDRNQFGNRYRFLLVNNSSEEL